MNVASATDDFAVEDHSQPAPPVDVPQPRPDVAAEPADATDEAVDAAADADEASDEDKAASEAARTLANRKRDKVQDRIDKAVKAQREAERRAEEAERRLQEREPPKAAKAEATADDAEPALEQFETFEAWARAHSRWTAKQVAEETLRAERATVERSSADRARHEAMNRRYADGLKAHADFDDVLNDFAESGGRFNAYVADVILEEDNGHDIAYALAKDPAALDAIQQAPSLAKASVLMGKFIARLEAASSGSAPKPPALTKANPPIKPVGSSSVTSDDGGVSDDLDVDEHIRRMNARDAKARRR